MVKTFIAEMAAKGDFREVVLVEDYEALLARAEDWMRQYGMYAHRAPDRTEKDIANFLLASSLGKQA